jgi:hypothetical protein
MIMNLFLLLLLLNNIVGCSNENLLTIETNAMVIKDNNLKNYLKKKSNRSKSYAAIYFTSSNCPSCKKVNKTLPEKVTRIKEKYNIDFYLCLYCETVEQEQKYLKNFSSFIHVDNEKKKMLKGELQVSRVPTMFLIDLNNFVIISKNILPNILKGTISKFLV